MIVKRDDTVYDKDERKVDMSDIKRPLSSVVDATPVFFTGSNLSIVNGCWTKQGLWEGGRFTLLLLNLFVSFGRQTLKDKETKPKPSQNSGFWTAPLRPCKDSRTRRRSWNTFIFMSYFKTREIPTVVTNY